MFLLDLLHSFTTRGVSLTSSRQREKDRSEAGGAGRRAGGDRSPQAKSKLLLVLSAFYVHNYLDDIAYAFLPISVL
jgi:hypothetical protein